MGSPKLSHLAETLIGSEIVRLGAEIKEKIKQGNKIYNYTIGDFDSAVFPIPPELEKEISDAYQEGYTNYPPADGIVELREAVSKFIDAKEGLQYGVNEVLIAAGGRPLIYSLYRAVVDPKDKVIYSVPSWNNNHYVHFTEGEHVVIEAKFENNFMPTAEDIRPHLSGATLLALCSPLNPTGTAFKKEELEAICDLVINENERRADEEKKLYVLYDQIYWTLTFGETRHYDPVSLRPAMRPYTIYIDGISKSFAATGVRVGWALGPANVLVKMRAINSHVGAWSPMAEQRATAKFLAKTEVLENYMGAFKMQLDARLRKIHDGFQQLKSAGFAVDSIAPQAAIYLTIQIDLAGKTTGEGEVLKDQAAVTSYILNEAKLAVVPFYAFGSSHESSWYRLSVGTCKTEEIDEMLAKLKEALSKMGNA
ncbi:MAG: aminotransferase class I/II-fold pyridoxal phosphate-dependent enzyme [Chitinophagaceae bacterium]